MTEAHIIHGSQKADLQVDLIPDRTPGQEVDPAPGQYLRPLPHLSPSTNI